VPARRSFLPYFSEILQFFGPFVRQQNPIKYNGNFPVNQNMHRVLAYRDENSNAMSITYNSTRAA
jgi:hypothetical protein